MKKSITSIILAFLSITMVHAQDKLKGNGTIISKSIATAGYDKISISGFFDIELIAGEEGKIIVEGEENLVGFIQIDVDSNLLKIGIQKGKHLTTSKGKKIVITVPFETLNEVSLAGSGDVITKSKITTNQFSTTLSGSGDINLQIDATNITAKLSGSGNITLKGKSENFNCTVLGSGDINATELVSTNVDSTITGSGDCKVFCSEFLQARVNGSGDIDYSGNPKKKDTKVTGSGSISKA